jgi:hypothetical protein
MTGDANDEPHGWFRESDLLDCAAVPLNDLVSLDQGALDVAIRRVLHDIDGASEAISSWSSFADR